jgi:hypothetical protein
MAPLVAIPLIFLGFIICLAVVLALTWILPPVRCSRATRYAVCGALLLVAIPFFAWCTSQGSRALIIVLAYGYDDYVAGLWIVNKHGDLTDGRALSEFWMGVWGALMFMSLAVSALPLWVFLMLLSKPVVSDRVTANTVL